MALTKQERSELLNKFGGRCAYCGCALEEKWHADHIDTVVRKDHGKPTAKLQSPHKDTIENMNPACQLCNLSKRRMSLEEWRTFMQTSAIALLRGNGMFRVMEQYGLLIRTDSPMIFYFEKQNTKL